ncbi:hypothetical protein B0T16DRAFT_392570 [Cercophora newfieldiana]|uniref:BTB domain-containing protein n=1 Tax=Cercophora newfieldiana TaxID=92897 RepID=A0AA39Y1A9_9PEZI|nr:hypothetical protein B0T16DRAFT_392570 [Cercophora newfieldiana]
MPFNTCLPGPGFRRWAMSRFRYARAKLANLKSKSKFHGKNISEEFEIHCCFTANMTGNKMSENPTAVVDDAAASLKRASSIENLASPKKLRSASSSSEIPDDVESERLSTITGATSLSDDDSEEGLARSTTSEINHSKRDDRVDHVENDEIAGDESVTKAEQNDETPQSGGDAANEPVTAEQRPDSIISEVAQTIHKVDTDGIVTEHLGETIEKNDDRPDVTLKIEFVDDSVSIASSSPTSLETPESDAEEASIITTQSTPHEISGIRKIKAVSYHIDADLYVKVKQSGKTMIYKVYSPLIAAASPVWRKMIYGGGCPRPPSGNWMTEMTAPEDDAYGLDVVFSIIHYKFHEMPERPDIDQLYAIARVAETYGCPHVLVPFMEKWITGLEWHITAKKNNDDDKTLYLTWVFGVGRWFARVVSRVAIKATIDVDGTLLDARGQPWKAQGLPKGILDVIAHARLKALKTIIDSINGPLEALMGSPWDIFEFCRSKDAPDHTKEQCQLQQLGSLLKGLKTSGLTPLPEAEEYKGSAQNLAAKVKAIKVAHFKLPNVQPHQDTHGSCGIQHSQAIDGALSKTVQLTGYFVQELKDRAKRCGAFNGGLFHELKEMEERNPSPIPEEDLREDGAHFKQLEDFDTAPGYYSESYAGVVIKVEDVDA